MNREIKFRARAIQDGQWIVGDLIHKRHNGDEEVIIQELNGCGTDCDIHTVGQFTGLKDKNGREIYEDDILRVKEYENLLVKEFSEDVNRFDMFTLEEIKGEKRMEYVSPIIWKEGELLISTDDFDMCIAAIFGDMKYSSPLFEFEVIGNIHENPELMKGGRR